MKVPSRRGTSIDSKRYRGWVRRFSTYRDPVSEERLRDWVAHFSEADRDLAARILDAVDFFGDEQIAGHYRQALGSLDGWNIDPRRRAGKWRFVALSRSAGESGDAMLYKFRLANKLDGRQHAELFITPSEMLKQRLTEDDTVVLLDDFTGTGTQVCEAWTDPAMAFGELLATVGRVYLIVVASTTAARQEIMKSTRISVVAGQELGNQDNVFASQCKHFTPAERAALLSYCTRADKKRPKGYGDCGLLVVFQHRTPNNSIPILHADKKKWRGVFPRHY